MHDKVNVLVIKAHEYKPSEISMAMVNDSKLTE